MNKFLKILPWILLIIVSVFLYYKMHGEEKQEVTVVFAPAKSDLEILSRYKDSLNQNHVTAQDDANIISKEQAKSKKGPKTLIDTVTNVSKIAADEITRITQIKTMTKDSLMKAIKKIDILTKQLAFIYADKYVRLKYTPPLDIDSMGTGTFDFSYNADLTITQYQKRKWFLAAKKSYIDIYSNDPRTTIRGVKQLTVQQDIPNFGLRFQASGNFNPQSGNLGLGPAVRLDMGRFSVQGNYLYYPSIKTVDGKKWRPGMIANYDIIRF